MKIQRYGKASLRMKLYNLIFNRPKGYIELNYWVALPKE